MSHTEHETRSRGAEGRSRTEGKPFWVPKESDPKLGSSLNACSGGSVHRAVRVTKSEK